eukprot:GHVU01160108.1.p1 GENE.GHVU01160108.1~~GHVU01160108.1.p1  ORF type:complete len:115 (+),score=29.18 GHVU01160108.1:61-405(+)
MKSMAEADAAHDMKGFATAINTILSRDIKKPQKAASVTGKKNAAASAASESRDGSDGEADPKAKKSKRSRSISCRVKPFEFDVARERQLKKLSVQGVVKLLNAVMTAQREKVQE